MPRIIHPLSAIKIKQAQASEKEKNLFDGGGLYLHIPKAKYDGTGKILPVVKVWKMKYQLEGKTCKITFGNYPDLSLEEARERRQKVRNQLANGIDPQGERKRQKEPEPGHADKKTFEIVAREWLGVTESQWAAGYTRTVRQRLENDVYPLIGGMFIADITPQDILKVLRIVEDRGAVESAHRIRMHISQVYDYAITVAHTQINPAARLSKALKRPDTKHMAAVLDKQALGRLMRDIEGYQGAFVTRCALRLAPMLFVRPGELRGMTWAEVNLGDALWSIPAERMKMKQAHVVPLSRQAAAILKELKPYTGKDDYVFSGRTCKRPMSNNTINAALRYLGWEKREVTGHGFRATARTLLDEELGFRVDLIEHQLAHAVKDPNGRAYNRTSFLEDRRQMMQAWADYLDGLR